MGRMASPIAVVGAIVVATVLVSFSFASSERSNVAGTTTQAIVGSAEAQLAREAAARHLARTVKRSSPVITATPSAGAS
jgi:hypothetical protein